MHSSFSGVLAFIFGVAATSGYVFTWLARLVAPRVGLLDRPDRRRKFHGRPTPLMGGVAILAGVLLAVCLMSPAYFARTADAAVSARVLVSVACFCFLGLIDDKLALRARTKFLGRILASLPFPLGTYQIHSVQIPGLELPLGMFGTGFTVLRLVSCANIVNLMDGLASAIGLVVAVTVTGLSLLSGNIATSLLSNAVAGSDLGFLFQNWPPAKMFLGDAGSLTIGFLLGALSFEASVKVAAVFTLTVPAVVLSVPAFDTLMAILRRKLNERGIGEGDRGHIHHRLQDRGLTKLQTLLAIGGLCLTMAATAIVATFLKSDLIAVATCLAVLALVIASRMFGCHEMLLVFRHIEALTGLFLETAGLDFCWPDWKTVMHSTNGICGTRCADGWQRWARQVVEVAYRRGPAHDSLVQRRWRIDPAQEYANLSTWTLQYTTMQNDGWIVTVIGTGQTANEQRLPRADNLFRLFHAVCEHWAATPQPVAPDVVPCVAKDETHEAGMPRTGIPSSDQRLRRAA